MELTKDQIKEALDQWNQCWDDHDLDGVMALFHEDVLFDNWTGGRVQGKDALHRAWDPWFRNHGGFLFHWEDLFIDEADQKVAYQWRLTWPSMETNYAGKPEERRGVDLMHFKDGKIIRKLTYSKTALEIEGKRVRLSAGD